MPTKTKERVVVAKDQDPDLTFPEAKELLAVLWLEYGHYKNVPSDYWTPDIHALESAKCRMWLRVFGEKFPPKEREGDAALLTKFEWQMVLRAAEMELSRLSVLRKECWTEGHHLLMSAYKKILGPSFS